VDRSLTSKLSDAREALLNVCVDSLKAYKQTMGSATGGLACPQSLMFLVPMVMGMLKHVCYAAWADSAAFFDNHYGCSWG
jgi:hypothetical protein